MSREHQTPIVGKIEGTACRLYNWNGFGVVVGTGKNTHLLDEIQHRRKKIKQNMILVVGSPGEGKSYFALRLAQILDNRFDIEEQVVFERTHLLRLIGANSPLKMGQAIVVDEAQFLAGARRWFETVQKDLMEHIEAVRSRGFVIIIVALHLDLLDKVIRRFVLSHMTIMKERGHGRFYKVWTPAFGNKMWKKHLGTMVLKLPDYEKCEYPNCLICKYRDECQTIRAIYERRKKEFLDKMSLISQQKAAKREQIQRFINYNDIMQKIIEQKDKVVYTKKGNPEIESVRLILEEEYGLSITGADAKRTIKRGKIKHPDVFKKEIEKVENS